MNVLGLDLSITATGVARRFDAFTITPRGKGDERLLEIRHAISSAVALEKFDLVAIEDLPTHAHSAGITGMVHGAVRTLLLHHRTPYVLIPPASVKKYATGKGNSGKPEMAVAALKRAGVEFGDDNQCDAFWLRAMALDHLGKPMFGLPENHRAALAKVAWPDLPGDQS